MPLTFVSRELKFNQKQIDTAMGPLVMANMAKPIGLGVLLGLGIPMILLGAFFVFKARKQKQAEATTNTTGYKNLNQTSFENTRDSSPLKN